MTYYYKLNFSFLSDWNNEKEKNWTDYDTLSLHCTYRFSIKYVIENWKVKSIVCPIFKIPSAGDSSIH